MNILYNDTENADICSVLEKIDKAIMSDDYTVLNVNSANLWLSKEERGRLAWVNVNYNLSINYQSDYNMGIKGKIKRLAKKVAHKLIKFNLISICLQQTTFNAEMVRIQNHQYEIIGDLKQEIAILRKECEELKELLTH